MTQNPFDPFALWRDTLSKWETGVNDLANKNMASPEFSQFVNQAMGMSVSMQHALGEMMGKYLTTMNMPTRADLAAIGERLQSIEDQLARLSAAVERASAGAPVATTARAGPPRTKRPPANLSEPATAAAEVQSAPATVAAPAARPARRAAKKKSKAS